VAARVRRSEEETEESQQIVDPTHQRRREAVRVELQPIHGCHQTHVSSVTVVNFANVASLPPARQEGVGRIGRHGTLRFPFHPPGGGDAPAPPGAAPAAAPPRRR
jgi:hypothetical protein